MISYDNYKNRIEKLAKVKHVLHKFRFLICGVLALIVGVSVGLMCAKGSYTSGMSLSAQTVNFNEYYEVTAAKAFLASPKEQRIEYSLEGSNEWTTQKPVKAGKYTARTVTKKIAGYSYSSPVTFDILPVDAEFTITSNSVVYGNTPEYTLTPLVSGHKVDESVLVFDYADYAAASTEVNAVESSLKIVDGSGDDFTNCYNVTFSGKTLHVRNRNLIATPAAYEFTYDGTGHSCRNEVSAETLDNLAYGDVISVNTSIYNMGAREDSVVKAGSYPVRIDAVRIMHGSTDVTARYNISLSSALLVINQRKLTITTQDGEKVYDGTPLVKTEVDAENLVSGHKVIADNSTLPDAENVGIYENRFGVTVLDGLTDVTPNYDVQVNAGTLKITHCKLIYTTADGRKEYDGTPLTNYAFTLDTTPAGFDFTAVKSSRASITDFGTTLNRFDIIIKKKSDGSVVTHNFDISCKFGTLEIEKRAMSIKTGSLGIDGEAQYNGQEQSNAIPESSNGLLEELGHELRVDKLCTVTDVKVTANGGVDTNGVDNTTTYTVWDGGRNVSDNYLISYVYGKLRLMPRRLTVTTNTPEPHTYDGTAFSDTGYTTDLEGGGLYNGDTLILDGTAAEITEVGRKLNNNSYKAPSANYVISYMYHGWLEVVAKDVKVTISHATSVYGADIPENGFILDCGELPNGETLTFTTRLERGGSVCTPETWEGYTLLNAGMYTITANSDLAVTGGNAHVNNYNFSFVDGILNITQREIYYVTATAEKVYDGTALFSTAYETYLASDNTKAGLLGGDKLTVRENPTSIIGAEERPNANYYSLPQFNNNYRIDQTMSEANFGRLKITPRPITVEISAIGEVTYGETFEYEDEAGNYANSPDLANGEKLKIAVKYMQNGLKAEPKNAGAYSAELDLENCIFYYADGTEIDGGVNNYAITCDPLENLKIKQFAFVIKPLDLTRKYGTEVNYPDYIGNYSGLKSPGVYDGTYDISELPYGEQIKILNLYYVKDYVFGPFPEKLEVGTHLISAASIAVYDSDGNEIQRGNDTPFGATENPYFTNYNFVGSNFADLQVVSLDITVTVDDNTATYGDTLSENTFKITENEMQYGEKLSLTYKYDREVKDVGDYEIIADKVFIDGKEVDIENCNYSFTFINGTLTVKEKSIYIQVKEKSCKYGEDLPDIEWWVEDVYENRITEFPYGDAVDIGAFRYYLDTTDCGRHDAHPHLDVGKYRIDYSVYINGSTEGLKNYGVVRGTNRGFLNVTAAELKITLADVTGVTYGDGGWTYPGEKTEVEGLKYNQTLSFDIKFTDADKNPVEEPKNAGTYSIVPDEDTYAVINEDGTEGLIDNYTVTVEKGTLEIARKDITVKIADQACVYGDDLPENSFKIYDKDGVTELVNGVDLPYSDLLSLEYKYDKTPKDAGGYSISDAGVYVDGEQIINGIAGNYNVDVETGTLTIGKKVLHIRFSIHWWSVGIASRYGMHTSGLDEEYGNNCMDIATENRLKLPYGEQLIIKLQILTEDGAEVEGIPDVGKYIERAIGFEIRNEAWSEVLDSGDGLILKNYEITFDDRPLSIYPWELSVTAENQTCVYGDDLPEIRYELSVPDKHTLNEVKQSIEFEFGYDREVKNAGEYILQINGFKVYDENGNEIVGGTKNFEYTLVGGTLTITPKTVYAIIGDTSAEYGGNRSIVYDFYLNAEGTGKKYQFPSDERCSVTCGYYEINDPEKKPVTPKNAGVYGVRVSDAYINGMSVPAGGEDNVFEHQNYTIVCVDGTFTVKPKKVTVELNQLGAIYYGEQFVYAAGVDNYANFATIKLAYGEKLEVAVEYLIDGEVGTPKNANYTPYNDRYIFAYSARLDEKACKVYESDGETVIANGADNYVFDCDALEDLKILRRTVYIYLNDIEDLPYGDEVIYPDEIGNYKRVEYLDVLINVEGVPYDEQFKVKVEYLDSNKNVVENPKNVGTYKIRFYSAHVYDSDGAPIEFGMSNYSFATAEPYQGTLEIVPREVKIVLNSYEKEYGEFKIGEYGSFVYPDGRDNYDVDNSDKLAFDEQISVEIKYQQNGADVNPKDAGLYNIVGVDFTVYDGENLADKDNYRVSYEAGELEITQFEFTFIISKNMQCTYGEELPRTNFYATDKRGAQLTGLPYSDVVLWVQGYYFKSDPDKTFVTPRNAGIYGITAKYYFINGVVTELDNRDGNYLIAVEDGELTINKARISIALDSLDDVYYGKKPEYATGANNYDTENSTKLADGDELEVAVTFINYAALDYAGVEWICGEYVIELDKENSLIHYNGETLPLLTNYEIASVTAGNVTVAPRAVEVTFESREYVYGDGTAGNEKFSIAVDVSDDTDGTLSATELPYGETLSFENSYVINGITVKCHNAGVYGIREGITYIDEREEGVRNYSFSFNTDATLTIKKKTVELTLDDMSRYYGDFYVLSDEGVYVVELPEVGTPKQTDVLEYGERLIVQIKFTEVGNEGTTDFIEPKNVGDYSIVATGYTVISYESGVYEGGQESGAGDELTNYIISCGHGTLKILKRKLNVALSEELTSVYGAQLPEIKPIVTSDGADYSVLPYDESLQISYHFLDGDGKTYYNEELPQNAGGYELVLDEASVNLGSGDYNYDITLDNGYLEITQRHIIVTVHGGSCTYGYEKLPELAFDITVNGNPYTLPYGEKLVPAYVFGLNGEWAALPQNAGVYEIGVDEDNCSVTGGNGRYSNYDADYYFDGSLTIARMELTVAIGGASIIYGEQLPEIPYTVTSDGKECTTLPYGDELKLDFTYTSAEYKGGEPEAAGEYVITATASIEGGNARIENYSVTYSSIEPEKQPVLTIAQREIEIVLNADGKVEFTYGTEFNGVICNADVVGAVDGQTINIAVTYAEDNTASAARTFARRARFMTARTADGFIPKNVGKYVASLDLENCTVTDENGAVVGGINNYKLKDGFTCKDVKFEITPMELTVTVKDAEAVYGSKLPKIDYEVDETMPDGESLELTFSYTSQPRHVGEYDINLESEEISGGEKSNYVINYVNSSPKLTITEKAVTVRVSDMSAPFDTDIVYSDAVDNYDTDNSDKLVDGDKLKVTEVRFTDGDGNEIGSRPDAGTYIIVFVDFEIVNADGEDATDDYDVTRVDGTLTINEKIIVIYTGSAQKEYDGTPLTCDECTYTGELAEGYTVVLDEDVVQFGVTYVTPAGGTDNMTLFKIVDKDGKATDNYKITYGLDNKTYGKLTVTRRNIEIVSQSASREYNGEELTAGHSVIYRGETAGVSAVAETDTFTPTTVSQIDVGSRPNTVTFTITDAEGNDVSENYAVTRTFGTLTVSRKSVNVTIKMGNAVYGVAPEISYETNVPLADGETLSFEVSYRDNHGRGVEPVTDGGYFILPVGDYRAYYVQNSAKIEGGREKATNYSLEFALGAQFSITKRHIIVTTATPEAREYDGTEFFNYAEYTTEWIEGGEKKGGAGIIDGAELTVVSFAKRTEVGSEDNICSYTATANYEIEDYVYGTLTITQRSLAVATEDITVTYDGAPHSDGTLIYNEFRLVEGHTIEVVGTLVKQTDYTAGVENRLETEDIIIKDADGKDVTKNYAVSWTYGTIIINKRALEITTGSGVYTYDGKPHGNPVAEKIGDSLLTELNHEVKVLSEYTCTNATEGKDNTTKYKVVCGSTDLSHNYNITYKPGKIVINKAAVTVTLKENVRAEYGSDYAELLSEDAVTLVNGETAELKIDFGTVERTGTYTATVDWDNSVIKDKNGFIIADGADNYEVELDPTSRSFEVIKRNISLTLNKGGVTEFVYGSDYGTEITNVSASWSTSGEQIKVGVVYKKDDTECTPENVGTYTAQLDSWTVEGGRKENYNVVSCDQVTFEITPKDLTVYMADLTVLYGGELEYPEGECGYTDVYGLVDGHTLDKVTPAFLDGTPEFAGNYDIVCGTITVNGGAVDAANYNVITGTPYGTLTIKGINIAIERKTVTKIYDGEKLALSENAPANEVTYYINGVEGAELETGLRLVLDGEFATADGNVSSSRANEAQYKVVDAGGNVAGNYVVTYVDNNAMLTIEQRELAVTTDDATRSYNGSPLTADCTYDESKLVPGHTLSIENQARIVDVGSTPNTMNIVISDADGKNVSANYNVDLTLGTLTVEELTVEIDVADMEKVYGEDINVNNYMLEAELVNGETLNFRVLYKDGGGNLLDGTTYLSVGEYGIIADKDNMTVSGGSGKLTNYTLKFSEGATLRITERHIIITTATPEAHKYDGNDFYNYTDYATEWVVNGELKGEDGLVGGDELTVVNYAKRSAVGSEDNICSYTASANYVIDGYEYGTIEVTERTISVSTADVNGTYNGKPHSDETFTYDESKLLEGHSIEVVGATVQTDATDGIDNVLEFKITDQGGNDVTDCYDIQSEYGTIIIGKAELTVTLNKNGNVSFAYGDSSFDNEFRQFTTVGLVSGETLTVELIYNTEDGEAPVNAGEYTVELDLENSFIAYPGDGVGIDNYEISCEAVVFEITRKDITLTLGAWAAEEYDGEEHEYDTSKLSVPANALLSGESIAEVAVRYCDDTAGLSEVGAPVNAGTYYVFLDLDGTTVDGADGEVSLSTNYNVTCAYVTFTVEPKKLTVTLSDVTHVYDGEKFDFAESDGFATSLCDGDEIECRVTYSAEPVDADTYTVTFDTDIVFTAGDENNYVFDAAASKLTCKLTIQKREITVTVADRDVEKGNENYTWEHISSETADGEEGFISSDVENNRLEVQFTYTDKEGKPEGAVEYKTVSATFVGEALGNYDITVEEGTLIVTERKVLVTPVYNGEPYVYDGNAVDKDLFGYTHVHNIENCADDDRYGFEPEHVEGFTATFTFTDKVSGKVIEGTPVNAGTYVVSVDISGDGIGSYLPEYETTEFTIAKRPLSYTVAVDGASEYTYSGNCPEFTAELTAYNGFANGLPEDMSFVLFDENNKIATRYDVGEYTVGIDFEGLENYLVTAKTARIKIVERVLVITPTDPYGGVAQVYNGTNLTLDEDSFVIRSGELANGDTLTVVGTEFAPSASNTGKLTIEEVIIVDKDGADVTYNYTVYSTYNATNPVIKGLGLSSGHFNVRVEYAKTNVSYTVGDVFGDDDGTFAYTGKTRPYTFDGSQIYKELGYGHYITVVRDTVTIPAAAGSYPDLILNLVRVYDGDGRNVTGIYNLICTNPEAAEITVTENVLSIDLSGVNVADLVSGEQLDGEVTGLYAGASPAHTAEVYAFDVDGEWIIGAVVFSTNASGRKTDLSANYKLSGSSVLSGATVKILTLDEAEMYSRSAIGVKITATAEQLAGGRGTVYAADSDGRWVLNSSYFEVDGTLKAGHELQVLVFADGDGYKLGVTVFTTENNRRKEAKNNYRLKDIVTTDVAAEYITVSAVSDMQRELYIDFSGAFKEDGTPEIENGLLTGYEVKGLNTADNHVIEVTVTDNGDGTYSLNVVVYQLKLQGASYKKFNKASSYKLVYAAPSQVVGASTVTGALS